MTVKPLECPQCRCPLTPPAAAATGMTCPRCKTWLEFDASCTGGCMTCFKTKQETPTPCCSTESTPVSLGPAEGTSPSTSKETGRGGVNLVAIGWKRLIQRLFAVR
jgi:hypothetical protein